MISTKDGGGSAADQAGREASGSEHPASDASGGASIDKVRDLLFGNQVREFERRFARLEDCILKETADLKEQLTARVAALEAFTKSETESLADRIGAEHQSHLESRASVSRELNDAVAALERRISTLDDQLARSQREVRQQILDQGQRLSDDIRSKIDDVLATLAREAQELRIDKADRATIAALLTDMAMRLTEDLPGTGSAEARNGDDRL